MGQEVLKTVDLVKKFGEFVAVNKVSLAFTEGERTAVIGPNGAGKTTFINLVSGQLFPDEGKVFLNGEDITTLSAYRRVRRGLNRTFQIPSVFKSLTVEENFEIASTVSQKNQADYSDLAETLGLKTYLKTKAGVLPYGLMKVLELGMAILSSPKVLLLDEPTAGLNVGEKERIVALLQSLSSRMSVIVVEHDMDVVFTIARRIVVMHRGELLADGPPEEIAQHEKVREVYLG
ncbi:MAG: ABC transporter ATP-binding protein [Candidatus Caldarchaeum sp.]|nr:ABC transporter ATP-binding protein [Candidatus Caldarchaeum sp.]MCS7134223.1 ABC transporter ATP-binding protein [Candidatus Caldarchaeum sp.]MCX8201744.1 ABC transporter ATP-binding protein [Candidatus Caldarchaeum sp.]MDW8063019.1 ABC transporter ATP-binding protein [Candidatus Caldarchaeum sp.]MDW8435623.1 ABC transporter ATP-binding protein [Candidatus Caldarchaeum sp.]